MLYMAARAYLGVPFSHQGRDPDVGIDCVGLLVLAGRDVGLPVDLHDRQDYGTDPIDGTLDRRLQEAFGPPVAYNPRFLDQLRPNDIVSIDYAGPARHVGIVGLVDDRLTLIHTSQGLGKVVEGGIDAKWLARIRRVYRPELPA